LYTHYWACQAISFDLLGGPFYHIGSMESEYLTKKELLAYLKVSRTIIEKLMRQGLPPRPVQEGRR
jgi:hypothetical protein